MRVSSFYLPGLFVAAAMLHGAPLDAAPLLRAGSAQPPLTAPHTPAVAALLSHPATTQARWVAVADDALMRLPDTLEWSLDGQPVRLALAHRELLDNGHEVAVGQVSNHAGETGTGVLVRSPAGLTGSFRVGNALLRLLPAGNGRHLLYRVDETRLPPPHPAAAEPRPALPVPLPEPSGPAATSVVRVLAVATPQAVAGYPGDLLALLEASVAEANLSYRNSQIDMRLQLAGLHLTRYEETRNLELDVRRLAAIGDGHLDEVHALRDQHAADVVALLLHRGWGCGIAQEIGGDARAAFIGLLTQCALGEYTLAHEVGHLQGARHDLKRDPAVTPFPFGHGHWHQPPRASGWRTVMSYDCPTGCRRIGYWSSPLLRYDGTPLGSAAQSDNRRVLELTRERIAGFR